MSRPDVDIQFTSRELLLGVLVLLASVGASHYLPWGFAQPPREACHQPSATRQAQPQNPARRLPACPRQVREVTA